MFTLKQLASAKLQKFVYHSLATLLYRVYVPNIALDATRGAGLPQPELTLSPGEILTDQAACDNLQSDQELLRIPFIPADTYATLKLISKNPVWRAAYNVSFSIECFYKDNCSGEPVRQVGWFSNLDNQYLL